MAFPVKMTLGSESWDFTGEDAKGLCSVSGMVRRNAEEMETAGAEGETIEVPMEGMKFDAQLVTAAIACLKASNWEITLPNVVASNDLTKLGLGAPSVELLNKYSATELHGLFAFAEYLECQSLRTLCLVKLASIAFMDPSSANGNEEVLARCNLAGTPYDMSVEKKILETYTAL
jgi:hypothetical protein